MRPHKATNNVGQWRPSQIHTILQNVIGNKFTWIKKYQAEIGPLGTKYGNMKNFVPPCNYFLPASPPAIGSARQNDRMIDTQNISPWIMKWKPSPCFWISFLSPIQQHQNDRPKRDVQATWTELSRCSTLWGLLPSSAQRRQRNRHYLSRRWPAKQDDNMFHGTTCNTCNTVSGCDHSTYHCLRVSRNNDDRKWKPPDFLKLRWPYELRVHHIEATITQKAGCPNTKAKTETNQQNQKQHHPKTRKRHPAI